MRTVKKKVALTQFYLLIEQLCLSKIKNNKAMISKKVAQENSAKTVKEKVVIPQQMRQ